MSLQMLLQCGAMVLGQGNFHPRAAGTLSPSAAHHVPHPASVVQRARAQSQLHARQLTVIYQVERLRLQIATHSKPMPVRLAAPLSSPQSSSTPTWRRGPREQSPSPAVGVMMLPVTSCFLFTLKGIEKVGISQDPPKRKEKLVIILLTIAIGESENSLKLHQGLNDHL